MVALYSRIFWIYGFLVLRIHSNISALSSGVKKNTFQPFVASGFSLNFRGLGGHFLFRISNDIRVRL